MEPFHDGGLFESALVLLGKGDLKPSQSSMVANVSVEKWPIEPTTSMEEQGTVGMELVEHGQMMSISFQVRIYEEVVPSLESRNNSKLFERGSFFRHAFEANIASLKFSYSLFSSHSV